MQLSRFIDIVSVGFSTAEAAVEVDMAGGGEGVLFIGVPSSTAVRVWSLALKSGATTTGFVNCASTHTHTSTAAGNNCVVTDVYKPKQRFIGATFSSTTATPSRTIAIKYGLRNMSGNMTAASGLITATGGVKRVVSPSSAT